MAYSMEVLNIVGDCVKGLFFMGVLLSFLLFLIIILLFCFISGILYESYLVLLLHKQTDDVKQARILRGINNPRKRNKYILKKLKKRRSERNERDNLDKV